MNMYNCLFAAICMLLIGNIVILTVQYSEGDTQKITSLINHNTELLLKLEKQGDGRAFQAPKCEERPIKNVFFDLGANRGDTALQVTGVEKTSDLGAAISEQLYQLGRTHPGPWDLRMYEAHPGFDKQLIETKAKIEALDPTIYGGPYNVYLFNSTAIGTKAGTTTFHLDVNSAQVWGSSLLEGHPDVKQGTNTAINITVPIHDLTLEIISNYRIQDNVVVKMDIEGIENELVVDLLVRGAFPYIDELYVEFHGFTKVEERTCLQNFVLAYASKYMKIGPWA